MKKRIAFALFALVPLHAAPAMSYSQCVALAGRDPAQAQGEALAWQNAGGGAGAIHCSALALTALKRYGEAGRKLDALARSREILNPSDRAALLDQAGNAWLLAGQPQDAMRSFSAALGEVPGDLDALIDRAQARAALKDWTGADADLGAALVQDQNRADLLVLRASARWALGRKEDAATDILRALELYPDYPPALVERGQMKYSAGDMAGARADWKKAASGRGDAAEEARQNLAAMDSAPGQ